MRFVRNRSIQILVDMIIICLSVVFAYTMRFEGIPPRGYLRQLFLILPYIVLLRMVFFAALGIYRLVWRYISLRDLPRILAAMAAGTLVIILARFTATPIMRSFGIVLNPLFTVVPFGVLAAELVLTSMGIISVRALWRLLTERAKLLHNGALMPATMKKKRALLVGAGSAGVMVAKEVATRPDVGFQVLGFLDDDVSKHGTIILGHKVLGGTEHLAEFADRLEADLVVITMANVPASAIRRIVELAEAAALRVQIIPGLYEILSGRVNISKIRDVAIEDLLGRAPVHLDEEVISAFLTNKLVMVTGAGGSIGSEMCRQICRYRPSRLLLLDQAENPLFHIHRELAASFSDVPLVPIIGNVVNADRMRQVMEAHRPEVVFHAAAHKHVPLMEANPSEAIRNNVLGTRNMADLANELKADAFVMVSTDKAVNPTSVMGATKRLAETYVQALSQISATRFITVRFGNVLGSEGSVVPIFKEQIARGGPVTVTHPEMKRYFMTIPEASQLVLQASAMGKGGEIFILDMGQPILITHIARDLIRLSGYKPHEEIEIVFSGLRPGEKLYEEINLSEENATKTQHPRIWIGKCQMADPEQIGSAIETLRDRLRQATPPELSSALAALVPEYTPYQESPDLSPSRAAPAFSTRERTPVAVEEAPASS